MGAVPVWAAAARQLRNNKKKNAFLMRETLSYGLEMGVKLVFFHERVVPFPVFSLPARCVAFSLVCRAVRLLFPILTFLAFGRKMLYLCGTENREAVSDRLFSCKQAASKCHLHVHVEKNRLLLKFFTCTCRRK